MRFGLRYCWRFFILLCMAVVLVEPAWCQESFQITPSARFLIGMESDYLWTWGNLLIPAGGKLRSGTRVNLNELNVESTEGSSIHFQAVILKNHFVNFDYVMFMPTGLTRVKREFRFQNKTYERGISVETKLDIIWLRLAYGYKLRELGNIILAPRIGVHHVRQAITINGETAEVGQLSNTRRLDATYPVVGLDTRYLLPYGIDFSLEMEGIHLVTRGFLAMAQGTLLWEVRPDVVLSIRGANRTVHYIETNQRLNNEWFYNVLSFSIGAAFTF
jgi:hypothetical protein